MQGEAVSVGRSVLAVFQRGQQIWSSAAAAQASGSWKTPLQHTLTCSSAGAVSQLVS